MMGLIYQQLILNHRNESNDLCMYLCEKVVIAYYKLFCCFTVFISYFTVFDNTKNTQKTEMLKIRSLNRIEMRDMNIQIQEVKSQQFQKPNLKIRNQFTILECQNYQIWKKFCCFAIINLFKFEIGAHPFSSNAALDNFQLLHDKMQLYGFWVQ